MTGNKPQMMCQQRAAEWCKAVPYLCQLLTPELPALTRITLVRLDGFSPLSESALLDADKGDCMKAVNKSGTAEFLKPSSLFKEAEVF